MAFQDLVFPCLFQRFLSLSGSLTPPRVWFYYSKKDDLDKTTSEKFLGEIHNFLSHLGIVLGATIWLHISVFLPCFLNGLSACFLFLLLVKKGSLHGPKAPQFSLRGRCGLQKRFTNASAAPDRFFVAFGSMLVTLRLQTCVKMLPE